ncbi:MAG: DUF1295 domain-containing protein [Anaerolineales bacterium]|jgi:hypothetical protein
MVMTYYEWLLVPWFILALATFIALFFVTAPYGRHSRSGWGPSLNARLGWMIMEAPAVIVMAACFWIGRDRWTIILIILFLCWQAHYVHRAFIYPWLIKGNAKRMPFLVMGFALLFSLINAFLIGAHLFLRSSRYTDRWLTDPRFLIGMGLFLLGFVINRHSDRILRNLRQSRGRGYYIPEGGLFRWVSCPNYLGEIIEWVGWAIATWSLAGLSFALWTVANLAPRARSHHHWYRQHFDAYPTERRILLPLIW